MIPPIAEGVRDTGGRVALTRQMMYRNSAPAHPMQAHKVESLGLFYTSLADGKEGVAAFIEKRPAEFESRASQMPDFYPWWSSLEN